MEKSKKERYVSLMNGLRRLADEAERETTDDMATVITQAMREIRQVIERLRRIRDDGEGGVQEPLRKEDIRKLGRDELEFIVEKFWPWWSEEICPKDKDKRFFCSYCRDRKENCDKELAEGEMVAEDYNCEAARGFYDSGCEGFEEGCWVSYYHWLYVGKGDGHEQGAV
jgi:hypothetical protein